LAIIAKSGRKLSREKTNDAAKLNYSRRNRPEQRINAHGITLVIASFLSEYRQFRETKGQRKIGKDSAAYFVHMHIIAADLYAAWQSDPNIYIGYPQGLPLPAGSPTGGR
jgi:hypothetical protein